MKRAQIDFISSAGKTIEGIYFDRYDGNTVLIALSDGHYAMLDAHRSYDELVIDTTAEFDWRRFEEEDMVVVFGADQVAEWQADDIKERERIDAERRERRRQEFERLKLEFEGKVD